MKIEIIRREKLPDGTRRNAGRFFVDAAEAARLVETGDARYVGEAPNGAFQKAEPIEDEKNFTEEINDG